MGLVLTLLFSFVTGKLIGEIGLEKKWPPGVAILLSILSGLFIGEIYLLYFN